MNICKIDKDDLLNGPGIRLVIWVQGCEHQCENCHNPETWDFSKGHVLTTELLNSIIVELNKPYYQGITLTGGCPFCQNMIELNDLLSAIKKHCPNKDIWCWCGEEYETLVSYDLSFNALSKIDVMVVGPYIHKLRKLSKYCGSSNQRVINIRESLLNKRVILQGDKYGV